MKIIAIYSVPGSRYTRDGRVFDTNPNVAHRFQPLFSYTNKNQLNGNASIHETKKDNKPDEWSLNICKSLNADTYYNPIGEAAFFYRSKYPKAGIGLNFLEVGYNQFTTTFTPYLSIIYILMLL